MKSFPSLLAIAATIALCSVPLSADQAGTTLTGDKTAVGTRTRVYHWTIEKAVAPPVWDMFVGDDADSAYTVTVTRDAGTDTVTVRGAVTVTNGGAFATENLSIVDCIQAKTGSGPYADLFCSPVDLSPMSVLAPGATYSYPYEIPFTVAPDTLYRNVANITITNHAGWNPGGTNCPGPELCPFGPSPKVDFAIPTEPNATVNESVHVDDTNGMTWLATGDATWVYSRNFPCASANGGGVFNNTATIRETGQQAGASVTVHCHELNVRKTAEPGYTRAYDWGIAKSVDPTVMELPFGATGAVEYTVSATRGPAQDGGWHVNGRIQVGNPAGSGRTAILLGLSDLMQPGSINGLINCSTVFPAMLAAGDQLECTYHAALPDGTDRTNVASAELRNHHYAPDGAATPTTATLFSSAPVLVHFDDPTTIEDENAGVTDQFTCPAEFTCTPAAFGPWGFTGTDTVLFATAVLNREAACDTHYPLVNSVLLTEADTLTPRGPATVTTDIYTGGCANGCTLTIGYWKTHAGFTGNNPDRVTELLPIWLGTPNTVILERITRDPPILPKSVIVRTPEDAMLILSMRVGEPSNGITKLYAQLLGTKLNIARGADAVDIAEVIAAADRFLRTHNQLDWQRLSKAERLQVLQWMTALDAYNNGQVGPGHCN